MRSLPAKDDVWLMASWLPSSDLPAFSAMSGLPFCSALAAARLKAGTSLIASI